MPPEGPLPILSKTLIQSKLTKKFFEKVKYINNLNLNSNEISNNNISVKKKVDDETNVDVVNNKDKKLIKNKSHKKVNINSNDKKDFKLKNKRVNTPTMKYSNWRYMENNKKNDNYKYNNNFDKSNNVNYISDNDNNNNDIQYLRKTAIQLQDELFKNEKIIEQQKKDNIQLKNKIKKLTEMLKSILSNDKI